MVDDVCVRLNGFSFLVLENNFTWMYARVTIFLLWIFLLYVEKDMVLDMFQWKYACVDVIRTTNLATMTGKKKYRIYNNEIRIINSTFIKLLKQH